MVAAPRNSQGRTRGESPAVDAERAVDAVVTRGPGGRPWRTLGQQLLAAVPESSTRIAELVGVSKQAVAQWRSGEKKPATDARRRLAAAFPSVPADAWGQRPADGASELVEGRRPRDLPGPNEEAVRGTLAELEELLDEVRAIRRDPKALPGERLKAMALSESLLARRAKLELAAVMADDELEDKWCHTKRWQAFERLLMSALRSHPGASAAVLEALEKLYGGAL